MNESRDRILAAAERIHRREGPSGLTLRSVAGDVGMTPMAIYRHFKDKDALIQALVDAGFQRWEQWLARAVDTRSPLKALERVLMAYADFSIAEPRAFELMFLTPRPAIPEAPASLIRSPSPSFEKLVAAVREAMVTGQLAPDDPAEVILFCWATVHGLTALHFTGRFAHDDTVFRRVYVGVVKRLLKSLRPERQTTVK
jgi:AcrR family transcriptional regulator